MAIKRSEVLSIDYNQRTKYRVIISALSAIILVFLFIFLWNIFSTGSESSVAIPACGDGSFYDGCNIDKPYYCDSATGQLIEKASLCGCPEDMIKDGESCISKYSTQAKEITLKYVLRGEEKNLSLNVYGGMVSHLSSLPKKINYDNGERPLRADFKIRNLNNPEQRELLLPLLMQIYNAAESREDQVRIAVSIVQNIKFNQSNETLNLPGKNGINYFRYPYEVLYDESGICSEKSELLVFLLREMGYDTAFFYYANENHEAVGVKCPVSHSIGDSGYCFIETTGASIITDSGIEYAGGIKLYSTPEIIQISKGSELNKDMYEYDDAEQMMKLRTGDVIFFKERRLDRLKEKYGLTDIYYAG